MQGTVLFFNNAKGWGFIKRDDGEKDLFVHFSAVIADGYKELKKDQRVSFSVEEGPKGKPQAVNVKVIA